MGFFYLEYAALALLVVYFARKLTLDETKRMRNDRSNVAASRGTADAVDKAGNTQDHDA
jgi:hypothetical protein